MLIDIEKILCGKTEDHLVNFDKFKINKKTKNSFHRLQQEARQKKFDLAICSSFRSYQKQCSIWNEKVLGKRPILDESGKPLSTAELSPKEIVFSILKWSALPGASRHHWGTEIDVYDKNGLEHPNDCPKLIPSECDQNGIFEKLHLWLDDRINSDHSFEFFRPYEFDTGGIASEKWHLSHRPVSEEYQKKYNFDFFMHVLNDSSFEMIETVRQHADEIYYKYISLMG